MAPMIDFYGIQQALADLISAAAITGLKTVLVEGMDREMTLAAMPLVNVRVSEGDLTLPTFPNGYYAKIAYEIDIVAFDFTKYADAVRVRDGLMRSVMDVIRANPRFHVDLETSSLQTRIRFGLLTPSDGAGYISLASFTCVAEAYIDAL